MTLWPSSGLSRHDDFLRLWSGQTISQLGSQVSQLGSLGGLAGAVLAPRIGRRLGIGPTIVGASVLFGPPLLLVPLASPAPAGAHLDA